MYPPPPYTSIRVCVAVCVHTHTYVPAHLGVYKMLFYFWAFVHERIFPFLLLPVCIAHPSAMNEARLSHLPFWGPSEAVLILIKRPSG